MLYTKIVGTTFCGGDKLIKETCNIGEKLILKREITNIYDPNAIAVHLQSGEKLGYLKKELAQDIAKAIDSGKEYNVTIMSLTGGTIGKENVGCNIRIENV